MTLYELLEKLKTKTIEIDFARHSINSRKDIHNVLAKIIEGKINFYKERAKEDETCPEDNIGKKNLTSFAKPDFIRPNKAINEIERDFYCFHCGRQMSFMLDDNGALKMWDFVNDVFTDRKKYFSVCEYKTEPHKTTIITDGILLFANFFDNIEDCPKEEKYTRRYDLNSKIGRQNIANYLAEQNVGYQQTGNMTAHFYKKGDSIIVSRYDLEFMEEEDDFESIKRLEGYDYVGEISCAVWRWMCIDKSKVNCVIDTNNSFTLQAKAGKWRITDLYGKKAIIAKLDYINSIHGGENEKHSSTI